MSEKHPQDDMNIENLNMEDTSKHATIINIDSSNVNGGSHGNEETFDLGSGNNQEITEKEIAKKNMKITPHICDHHDSGAIDKFKSEIKIFPVNYDENEILTNIQSQIEESRNNNPKSDQNICSIKLEIRSPEVEEIKSEDKSSDLKNLPLVSTITVQTKQGSELKNGLSKINKPVSSTDQNDTFFSHSSKQDQSLTSNKQHSVIAIEKPQQFTNSVENRTTAIVNNNSNFSTQPEETLSINLQDLDDKLQHNIIKNSPSSILKNNDVNNDITAKNNVVTFDVSDAESKTIGCNNLKHENPDKTTLSEKILPVETENHDSKMEKEKRNSNIVNFEENLSDKTMPSEQNPTKIPEKTIENNDSSLNDQISKKLNPGCAETGVFTKSKQTNARTEPSDAAGRLASSVREQQRIATRVTPPMSSMEEESLRERIRVSLLRHCGELAQNESRYSKEMFKRLFHSKEFLEQLFKLFDQDRDNQLHQDNWIEFLKERLSDEKQIDFAEQVESVTYVLCGNGPITLEHFNQIFHAKGIVDKLFRLVDQGNVGTISAEQVMEFVSNITNTRPRTGFDKKSLESLEQLFRQTVGNEKEIRREDFQKIVISKNPFFTERVFQIFDKDNSGSISLQEFLDSMHQFAGQSPDDKIKFLFKIYDIDGDGLIQHRELQHVMRACMEENGMQFSEEQIDDLTIAMFEDADTNNRGAITYEALKNQLEKHGGLLENLSISIDRWLVPPKPKAPPTSFLGKLIALRPYQLTRPYLKNNYVYLIFLAAFIILNLGLFISRAVQYASYENSNGYVIVARACGQCLNFNCMFVLVLMLRQCITYLRTRGFSSILPLDHHIYLHKMTGMFITFFSVLHTIMHLLNFSLIVVNHPVVNSGNYTLAEWLLTDRPGLFGLIPGLANPTGVVLFIILVIIFICSQAFVRRGGCFEIFYWTHLLYIPFWVLLIFHGPNFWKWFIIPGILYLIERILRLVWMKSKRGKTYISSGLLLPSKVTHLVIKRPLHFDFHPGDYVFVNIPAIAKYEWHPFTLSSAPEQEDYMWLHIRAVGEWTNRLYNYFEKEQEKLHNGEIPPLLPGGQTVKKPQLPTITNDSNTFRRLHASIKRKFSNRDPNRAKGDAQLVRYTHEKFANENAPHVSASDGEINNRASSSNEMLNYPALPKNMLPEKRFQMLLYHQKVPLEKSLSMPDIQTKAKKRERLLVLREYMRSESEKSFDECQIRRARLQSLGLAYLSPQNKSLAQSFRYMRHKPTIIAFKTPSLENWEAKNSSSSLGSVGRQTSAGSFTSSPERQAEEGRLAPLTELSPGMTSLKPVNYPVGKPLEPIPEDRSILEVADIDGPLITLERLLGNGTEIYLDGPYGAPSSHIFRAQHAVLIATGIGVTPFASILQSIMHRYWKARHCCPKCKFAWASEIPATVMNLRKVDFFWINRDQRSFEWFVNLLSQLEIEQAELGGAMERFLEMHMYITSALQKTDMKAVGLQLALDLLHEKEKRDLITGLKTRTNAGRPNWDKVFKQLQDQKKGKVTVFYCGPPQLSRILRYKCDQYGFSFRKETF